MQITLTPSTAERIALRRLASETGKGLEEAPALALQEYLICTGDLELASALDEDTEIAGEAWRGFDNSSTLW